MNKITPKTIAEGIHYCIENATILLDSAELLYKNKKLRTAQLLIFYALEEMGKVPLVWNLPFYVDDEKKKKNWENRFKNHKEKFWFSKDIDDFLKGELAKKKNKKASILDQTKQSISYVGFNGKSFSKPRSDTPIEIKELLEIAKKRMIFLRNKHKSLTKDEAEITESIKQLKGKSQDELLTMFIKLKNKKTT